ncbi:hypothetical protein V6N13_076211 [Hibiscus sabdariffa]
MGLSNMDNGMATLSILLNITPLYLVPRAVGGGNDDESNKSKSEVHDDEEVASGEDEDEDDNIQQWNFRSDK